MTRSEC